VLADIKRGLSSTVLLELEPGASYRQTTHAMLLRGQLLAADAPEGLLAGGGGADDVAGGTPRKMPVDGLAPGGGGSTFSAALRRSSMTSAAGEADAEWEATLAASVASPAAPQAPRILPWLWCSRYRCNQATAAGGGGGSGGLKLAADQMWRAGPEGALLLVCLTEAGEVPEGVLEAEDAAELAAMEAAAADTAAGAASPLSGGAIKSHPLDFAHDSGSGGLQPAAAGTAVVAAAAAGAGTEEGSAARALERIASQPPPRASGLM
jgi:hypothetical protein